MRAGRVLLLGSAWALVYGIMNGISNANLMPSATVISLRPQVALPMAVGIAVHPLAGFLAGFAGNVVGDGLSSYGFWKFWNWHLANGLMGLIPGLIRYAGVERIATVRDFGKLEAAVITASALSVGIATGLDRLFLHFMAFPESLNSWILPAFLTDAVNGFILVPLLLIVTGRLVLTLETRTILMVTFLLVAAVLCTSFSITWSVWDDLVSPQAMIENFYLAGVLSVLFIVAGFVASIVFVRRITDPLSRLARAAHRVEEGRYDLADLEPLSRRSDEMGHLSRVLRSMAEQVSRREEGLKRRVEELEIRIDQERKARDVAQIVETQYFQSLKKKAREFRSS
jgi:HAMP domain-containing protein/uncharacterized membrane protein